MLHHNTINISRLNTILCMQRGAFQPKGIKLSITPQVSIAAQFLLLFCETQSQRPV